MEAKEKLCLRCGAHFSYPELWYCQPCHRVMYLETKLVAYGAKPEPKS